VKKTLKRIIIFVIIIAIVFLIYENRKVIMKRIYVTKYSEYVEKYSKEYEVDKYLIYAVIKAESNFNENAESKKGAKGLMQLMYSTAQDISKDLKVDIDENSLLNPETNIKFGTSYISKLKQKYKNIELALTAYNAGSGNVDSWIKQGILKSDGTDIENIPFRETNNYVRKILRDYEIYKRLYNKD